MNLSDFISIKVYLNTTSASLVVVYYGILLVLKYPSLFIDEENEDTIPRFYLLTINKENIEKWWAVIITALLIPFLNYGLAISFGVWILTNGFNQGEVEE